MNFVKKNKKSILFGCFFYLVISLIAFFSDEFQTFIGTSISNTFESELDLISMLSVFQIPKPSFLESF